jgi:anti-sigma regulatory factor (Ser/Thr protein kinase)
MSAAAEQLAEGSANPSAHHVVQLYRGDEELVDCVTEYLRAALAGGDAAIIVATAAHRAAFEARLSAEGIDVASALADGALVTLDAGSTMRRFLISEQPDPGTFAEVFGNLIQVSGRHGRSVHVYGEMVALLWSAGHVTAALELEAQWNALAQRLPFSLFCAYAASSVSRVDDGDAFAEMCALHSAIVGPGLPDDRFEDSDVAGHVAARGETGGRDRTHAAVTGQISRLFPKAFDAPRAARHFVVETLQRWCSADVIEDAALIVTELATNAVLHARSAFTVAVSWTDATVRVSVEDASPITPSPRPAGFAASSGRGLGLVAAVASRWSTQPVDGGKVVWADIAR